MLQLFAEQRRKLDLLRDACQTAGLKDPFYSSYERLPVHQNKQLCDLIRDIFGNPLRELPSVALAWPAWNDSTVHKMAQAIFADHSFDHLPILADALADAGCDNTDILSHCRGPGPHVRGCWVVDLLLGKN
jgi:hypothetical protein